MSTWTNHLLLLAQMAAPPGQPGAPEPVPLPHPEIAPPVELPGGLPLWVAITATVLVLALFALVVWLLLRPKPPVALAPRQPAKTALKALRALRAGATELPPPEVGHRVSEILRVYFMGRYSVPALYRTTPELFPKWHDAESETRRAWRERFEPLACIYDEIAFAPQPVTHAQAQSLIESAISKLEEERA